jgi:hypothetical protein
LALLAAGISSAHRVEEAGDPGDFIQTLGNQAVHVIESSAMPAEKIAYFRQPLEQGFDMPAIARFVPGPCWRGSDRS